MIAYTETIRRYAADNRYVGQLDNPDGIGEVGLDKGEVGRQLAVRFTLNMDHALVKEVRFQVFGCGFTVAACAAAAGLAKGGRLVDLQGLSAKTIAQQLGGLPEQRSYCAELACQALQAALTSVSKGSQLIRSQLTETSGGGSHGPRVTVDDAVYKALLATSSPASISAVDRKLFACLLAVTSAEPYPVDVSLGLAPEIVDKIIATCFPGFDGSWGQNKLIDHQHPRLEINSDVLSLLLSHVEASGCREMAGWLAHIIAARAAQPGHLWIAMGLFERPQLTAAIRRHLPTLAQANNQGMRWKRYLFKQVCEANGGLLCKSPNCQDCSEYELCFAPQES
ncbi:nitrogen fixation protein NifQ [Desulfuromusa kysingii]|uniref:Nitrogen fixation protein NifQ n=1 Tax=Desulfuromusa kysingii TaxID=37625 RepID=A0A1H4DJJ9_9BACT|nr:nitrogen fixation protein NifQ [Desulfuromusa kysingii]SEA72392.1 nitrogen fixation protein NifQ [Desulfuromusa kysingii]